MSDPRAGVVAVFACPSCGTESVGKFCRNCGEQKLGTEDRSLRHYFDIVINFLTHFDSKGYRTLWLLVTRPGFLSSEQLRGSRVRYVKPLALFVSINVVYYFSIAYFGGNTFTTPLEIQLRMNDYYPAYANTQVERKMRGGGDRPSPSSSAKFNAKTSVLSRTLIFFFIPIYAALFFAFFFRRPGRFFVEHLVVATHFWSFILILLAVAVPAIAAPFVWWSRGGFDAVYAAGEVPLTVFLQICIGVYLTVMLHRVYAARLWYCVIVAVGDRVVVLPHRMVVPLSALRDHPAHDLTPNPHCPHGHEQLVCISARRRLRLPPGPLPHG